MSEPKRTKRSLALEAADRVRAIRHLQKVIECIRSERVDAVAVLIATNHGWFDHHAEGLGECTPAAAALVPAALELASNVTARLRRSRTRYARAARTRKRPQPVRRKKGHA